MATVAELQTLLTVDADQLKRGLDSGSDKIKSFARDANTRLGSLAKDFATFGVGAAVAIGGAALSASISWEDSFADVAKTVGDLNDEELAELEQTLRNMATSGVTGSLSGAHEQLAAIAALGGQLGVAGTDLDEFTTTVAAFGVAVESMTTEDAAVFFAQFANITGLDIADDIDNIADAVVHLGNNSATNESQIAAFGLRLGQLSNVGFDADEILGWGTAMASLGISAELGSTNFALSVSDMQRAAREGGTELDTFAATAGLTADEFAELANSDPSAAFDALILGLSEMDASDAQATLDALNITGTEQRRVMTTLAGSYDTVTTSLDLAEEGFAGNNAAMNEAGNKAATTGAKMNLLKNKVSDLAIALGDELSPGFNTVLDGLIGLTDGDISGLTDITTGFIDMSEAVAGIFGAEGGGADGELLWSEKFEEGLTVFQDMPDTFSTIGTLIQQNLAIAWDNISRDIDIFALETVANMNELGAGIGAVFEEVTGVQLDFGHTDAAESAREMVSDMRLADALTEAIQGDLATGSIDLSDNAVTIDGLTYMFGQSASINEIDAEAMGLEGRMAIEEALTMAFASGDEETQNLLLPLAMELDLPIDDIQSQAESDVLDAVESQAYSAIITVDMIAEAGMINLGALDAAMAVASVAVNGGAGSTTVYNSYGENSAEFADSMSRANRDMGPR